MNAIGIVIMSAFAALWWSLGLAQSGHGSLPGYAAGALVSAVLCLVALRRQARLPAIDPQVNARIGRLVGIASGAEGVLILITVNVLANTGHADLIMPAIAIIVGLHFLPLARGIPVPAYYVTAVSMCVLGVAACALPDLAQRLLLTGTGMAVLLWLTCLAVLARLRPHAGLPLRPSAA